MIHVLCFSVELEANKQFAVILINLTCWLHPEAFKNGNLVITEF